MFNTNWGWHLYDSFDQFGFAEIGHGVVAALELGAREAVAVLQRQPARRIDGSHRNLGLIQNCYHGRLLVTDQSCIRSSRHYITVLECVGKVTDPAPGLRLSAGGHSPIA
jgi:hypothetical protein